MRLAKQCVVAFVLMAAIAHGQGVTSSVTGVVVDPSSAAVPSVECSLVNEATGTAYPSRSGTDGFFSFSAVPAGTYTLTLRANGFRTLSTTNVKVTASEIRTLGKLALQLGDIVEKVDVKAEVAAVQLASGERSGLISGEQINDIAVRGRDFLALLATIPGVVDTLGTGGREVPQAGSHGSIVINGARGGNKLNMLDGILNRDIVGNQMQVVLNMDAIAEVKVMTSNYQAEFGRNSGGVVSVITKSGTKDFHGTAYWFLRNEALNANTFYRNRTGTPKAPSRFNTAGVSIGGPAYIPGKLNRERDKLFFFFSQEYIRQRRDYGQRFVNMPTAQERDGEYSRSFDVNGRQIAVRDPISGQPFAGNMVPRSRLNSLGQKILNFYPLPNYTDPDPNNLYRWNFRSDYSGQYPKRQDVVRLDANFWPSLQVFYRYVNDADEQLAPWGLWLNGGVNYLLTPIRFGDPGKTHAVSITKTFSPSLVNEFKFGYVYGNFEFTASDYPVLERSRMGNPPQWFKSADKAPVANIVPDVAFGGQPENAVNSQMNDIPFKNYAVNYIFTDNVNKVLGSHNVKGGVYFERSNQYQPSPHANRPNRGSFSFARDVNNPFDSGHAFANAGLGNFAWYEETTRRPDGDYWVTNFEWYLQDNWRITKRLTLDYGLRFYHNRLMEERNGNTATFDPTRYDRGRAPALYMPGVDRTTGRRVAIDPVSGRLASAQLIGQFVAGSGDPANGMGVAGKDGVPSTLYTAPALALGPRFGFAYDVFGNGKTALRGGFGRAIDVEAGNILFFAIGNPPIGYIPRLWYGNLDTYASSAGAIGPTAQVGVAGHQKFPVTSNFSLGVQQRFWNTTLEASYVGSLARHLPQRRNINPISMFARFNPANADPSQPARPLPDNFLRLYPGYDSVAMQEFTGTSNYHSLQVSANRRYTRGLQFGLAYTWSKVLGVANAYGDEVSPYFPMRQRNYGPLGFDRSHVFVFNYTYDLPKLGSRLGPRPARWILDNWQASGITSFISGGPFTPSFGTVDGQDITGSSEGARITVVGDPRLSKGDKTYFRNFNPEVFRRTPRGGFGNAGVGILRGPGINNWDISISKRFPLFAERRFLQFRTELFNAWNHTQFSGLFANARFDASGQQVDPNFGAFSAARDPRTIQFSLKLFF